MSKCSEKCIHQYFCKFKDIGEECDYFEEETKNQEESILEDISKTLRDISKTLVAISSRM